MSLLQALSINNRDFYRSDIKNQISRLKRLGEEAVEEAQAHIELIMDTRYRRDNSELQAVYLTLLLSLDSDSEVRDIYELSRPQLVYASGLISAIVDCISLEI